MCCFHMSLRWELVNKMNLKHSRYPYTSPYNIEEDIYIPISNRTFYKIKSLSRISLSFLSFLSDKTTHVWNEKQRSSALMVAFNMV